MKASLIGVLNRMGMSADTSFEEFSCNREQRSKIEPGGGCEVNEDFFLKMEITVCSLLTGTTPRQGEDGAVGGRNICWRSGGAGLREDGSSVQCGRCFSHGHVAHPQ